MIKILPLLSLLLSSSLVQAYTVHDEGENMKKTHLVLRLKDGGKREAMRQEEGHPTTTNEKDLQRGNAALKEKLAAAQKKKERLREQLARREDARRIIAGALKEEIAEFEARVAAALKKQKELKEQLTYQTSS